MANTILTSGATAGTAGGTASPFTDGVIDYISGEVYFNALPNLKFMQAAVTKTQLGTAAGLDIVFHRYADLSSNSDELVENVDLETEALDVSTFQITITEHGKAVAITEKAIKASFLDVVKDAAKSLGRTYAVRLDSRAREAFMALPNRYRVNDRATRANMIAADTLDLRTVEEAVTLLGEMNVPKFADMGDVYLMYVSPRQLLHLKQDPRFEYFSVHAQPNNIVNGAIGRYMDVVFIVTTQVRLIGKTGIVYADNKILKDRTGANITVVDYSTDTSVFQSVLVGENCLGYAVGTEMEIRDNGVQDFYRRMSIAYYEISGFGLLEQNHGIIIESAYGS